MTILVVDDDSAIREFIADFLRSDGYKVLTAQDGLEAYHCLKTIPEIRLLVSDLEMPCMDGMELAGVCLNIRPDVRIILCSGNISGYDLGDLGRELHAILEKPFKIEVLSNSIRLALAG